MMPSQATVDVDDLEFALSNPNEPTEVIRAKLKSALAKAKNLVQKSAELEAAHGHELFRLNLLGCRLWQLRGGDEQEFLDFLNEATYTVCRDPQAVNTIVQLYQHNRTLTKELAHKHFRQLLASPDLWHNSWLILACVMDNCADLCDFDTHYFLNLIKAMVSLNNFASNLDEPELKRQVTLKFINQCKPKQYSPITFSSDQIEFYQLPLTQCVCWGSHAVLTALLQKGHNPNSVDPTAFSVFCYALHYPLGETLKCAVAILEHATMDVVIPKEITTQQGTFNTLQYVADRYSVRLFELLRQRNFSVELVDIDKIPKPEQGDLSAQEDYKKIIEAVKDAKLAATCAAANVIVAQGSVYCSTGNPKQNAKVERVESTIQAPLLKKH